VGVFSSEVFQAKKNEGNRIAAVVGIVAVGSNDLFNDAECLND
jgi:hypothetical protein